MDRNKIAVIKNQFDRLIHTFDDKVEFWYARELMKGLGYDRWENFNHVIQRAMESCESSGIPVSNHFREVTKMIPLAKGARGKGFTR